MSRGRSLRLLSSAPLGLALLLLLLATAVAGRSLLQDSSVDDAAKARALAAALKGSLPNIAKFGYGGCCGITGDNRKGVVSPPLKWKGGGAGGAAAASASAASAAAAVATPAAPTGVLKLGLAAGAGRDGYVYVPSTYSPDVPTPLIVALHGANKTAFNGMATVADAAAATGAIVVAPSSRDPATWDMFGGGYGSDVAYINASIAMVSDLYNIDPTKVAIQGFSDGATYALSLGLANGKDVFSHVIAFSPGGLAPPRLSGSPGVFVSAGTDDEIFPKSVADAVVCQLVSNQYPVTFAEFKGGHSVPTRISNTAVTWFVSDAAPVLDIPTGLCDGGGGAAAGGAAGPVAGP